MKPCFAQVNLATTVECGQAPLSLLSLASESVVCGGSAALPKEVDASVAFHAGRTSSHLSVPGLAAVSPPPVLVARHGNPKVLYLFSGPRGLPGGFDGAAASLGLDVEYLDLEVSITHDLCDDTFFAEVCGGIVGGALLGAC